MGEGSKPPTTWTTVLCHACVCAHQGELGATLRCSDQSCNDMHAKKYSHTERGKKVLVSVHMWSLKIAFNLRTDSSFVTWNLSVNMHTLQKVYGANEIKMFSSIFTYIASTGQLVTRRTSFISVFLCHDGIYLLTVALLSCQEMCTVICDFERQGEIENRVI